MLRQQIDYGGGVLRMHTHARMQGADSAQRQEGVERRTGHADGIRPPRQRGVQLLRRGDHGAAHYVTVPVQIFGRRVQDEIGAERERLLPDGR